MKGLPRYALVAFLAVAVGLAVSWALLDGPARLSVGVAAIVALPIQLALFALLESAGRDSNRFLVWWGVGILGRMGVVAAVALLLAGAETLEPTALVMSTAGFFFFVLLLLEPAFLTRTERVQPFAR